MARIDHGRGDGKENLLPGVPLRPETLRQVWSFGGYFQPYRGRFLTGVAALVSSAALGLVFPSLAGSLIDGALRPAGVLLPLIGPVGVNGLALVLVAIVALQVTATYVSFLFLNRAAQGALAGLRADCYRNLISMPMAFYGERRVGELTSRISTDVGQLEAAFVEVLPQALRQAIYLLGGVVLIALTSAKLTALILATVIALMVVGLHFGRRLRSASCCAQDELANTNTIAEETLQAIASVKAFANEDFEMDRFNNSNGRILEAAVATAKWRAVLGAFFVSALFGGVILILWFGARLLQKGEISVGVLTRFILYTVFVAGALGHVAELLSQLQRTLGATQRLEELLHAAVEDGVAGRKRQPKLRLPALRGDVFFEGIHFRYPSRIDHPVLRGLSLRVRPGESIALVGGSGAGKSTLMALLMRFYDPQEGSVLIDGRDARDFPICALRNQIAIVPQEVLLFGGTIAENIGYGRPGAEMTALVNAAKLANAHDFVSAFPEGYQTVVGERGIKLSGGQRQRIAIARAILKDPAILILDEATNSLDSESERLIQDALETLMKGRTSFIIAHRFATIRKASSIAVIKAGRLVELGTHDDLFSRPKGHYRHLSNLQYNEVTAFTAA
jgi:ATP-binding cassette subfamily B protein